MLRYRYNQSDHNHEGPNFIRFMTDNGLPEQLGGRTNMAGDWTGLHKPFWVEADEHAFLAFRHANIFMAMDGKVDSGGFGSGDALVEGLKMYVYNQKHNIYIDVLGKNYIKTNEGWKKHCFNVIVEQFGKGDTSLSADWDFTKDGGPVTLEGGDKIIVVLNEDIGLTRGIKEFTINLGGSIWAGSLSVAEPDPEINFGS